MIGNDTNITDTNEERTFLELVFYLIGILLRYKYLIIIITGLSMIAVVGISFVTLRLPPDKNPMPNIYKSTAVIQLESNSSSLSMDSLLASMGIRSEKRSSTDMSLVVEYILNSGTFLDQLVDEFDLINKFHITENVKTKSRRFLRDSSSHTFNINSGMMDLSFISTDPEFAMKLVNKKVELLQEWFLKEGGSVRNRQMELLEKRMMETQNQINKLELEIKSFQNKYGVFSVEALSDQLEKIRGDLQRQLVQTDMEIQQYSRYSRIEDPALTKLRSQRQNILSMLAQIDSGYIINGRTLPSREELADLSIEFSRLSMNLRIQTQIYEALAQRYEAVRLAAIEGSVFTVLEWGEIPEEKIGPNRGQLCMKVTIGAFIVSIAIAFGIYYLRELFRNPKVTQLMKYGKGS